MRLFHATVPVLFQNKISQHRWGNKENAINAVVSCSSYDHADCVFRLWFISTESFGGRCVPGYVGLSSFYLYHRYQGSGTSFHAPEIDIVEYLGENPFGDEDAFQTYHYESPSADGTVLRSAPTMAASSPDGVAYGDDDEWHTFSVLWEPQLVIW